MCRKRICLPKHVLGLSLAQLKNHHLLNFYFLPMPNKELQKVTQCFRLAVHANVNQLPLALLLNYGGSTGPLEVMGTGPVCSLAQNMLL